MRKREYIFLFITILLLGVLSVWFLPASRQVTGKLVSGNDQGNILTIDRYGLTLKGTDKDGVTYFCLPSYAGLTSLDQTDSLSKIYLADGTLLTEPHMGTEQDVLVDTGDGSLVPWKLCFMRSENLYSVFLDTKDTPLSDIEHDVYSDTGVTVISPSGRVSLSDKDAHMKGRGNATWTGDKKPYEIKLSEEASLCDMPSSKKWTLIANYFDSTKLDNKLAFDTSKAIGMEYAVSSDWVDLYANGAYLGNYLLCREPHIGKADLDTGNIEKLNSPYFDPDKPFETEDMKGFDYDPPIPTPTGGYLIEKNTSAYYEKKKCGFKTNYNYFTIKSPDNASREQIEYIKGFIESIDSCIRKPDTGSALSRIDVDSFAKRFIMEELFFNNDACVTSYYFYKKPDDELLYAGPVWDYDGALGAGEGPYIDPEGSILYQDRYIPAEDMDFKNPLLWDALLYENDEYKTRLIQIFKDNIPVFTDLINRVIDEDYERIEASLLMDYAVWRRGWGAGHYEDTYDNVRYTKYFLSKRLAYLCERWDVPLPDSDSDFSDGSMHTLTFNMPDGSTKSISVKDGDLVSLKELPSYDESLYSGWYYYESFDPFSPFIPVYEDMAVELHEKED